jgi:hypothetical protein
VFGTSYLRNLNAADEPALQIFVSYPIKGVASKHFYFLEDGRNFAKFLPHPGNDATFTPVVPFTHASSTVPSFFP